MSSNLVKDMDLSTRARTVLDRMQITTIEDLLRISIDELSCQHNIDTKTLEEIKTVISDLRNGAVVPKTEARYSEEQLEKMSHHSIDELGLSIRSYHFLVNHNVFYLDRVAQLLDEDPAKFNGLGHKSILEIHDSLNKWVEAFLQKESNHKDKSYHITEMANRNQIYVCPIPLTESLLDEMSFYSLEELDLSVRPYNILSRNGIETIDQLAKLKLDELGKFKSLGKIPMREIQNVLNGWINKNLHGQTLLSDESGVNVKYFQVVTDCVKLLKPICNITVGKLYHLFESEEKLELLSLDGTEESRVHNFALALSLSGLLNLLSAF